MNRQDLSLLIKAEMVKIRTEIASGEENALAFAYAKYALPNFSVESTEGEHK